MKVIIKFCLCVFCLLSINTSVSFTQINIHKFNSINLFTTSQKAPSVNLTDYVEKAILLELQTSKLKEIYQIKQQKLHLSLPLHENQIVELDLKKVKVLADDFRLTTSDGQSINLNKKQAVFYRGTIKDNPNTLVALSIFEDEIRGFISNETGNHVLGKLLDGSEQYIIYNDQLLKNNTSFDCGINDNLNLSKKTLLPTSPTAYKSAPGDCVELYVECDYALFLAQGSNTANVNNFVVSLVNEVATLYANENINLILSEVFVWTSTDPYASISSNIAILEKFGETRQNNYNGRLAHLLSSRNLGGGIAWQGVLCTNYITFTSDWDGDGIQEIHHAGPYGLSGGMTNSVVPVPTYSNNVQILTHELGHNFGSPHTHACEWGPNNDQQIDDCGNQFAANNGGTIEGAACFNSANPIIPSNGTIMSYCNVVTNVNFNNGFGTEPGDLIRDAYNSATCLTTCPVNAYCNNSSFSDANEWIKEIRFNTLYNTSGQDGGYGDYTTLSTSVANNQSYPLSLSPGFSGSPLTVNWSVYIDWNQDTNFNASELVLQTSSQNTVTNMIAVPASAPLGSTRMRVILSWNSTPSNACTAFSFGEIEDYTINVVPNDFCDGATILTCGTTISNSTATATNTDNPNGTCGVSIDNALSRWYSFVGTGDEIEVTTCSANTNFDTKLFVYTGNCSNLTCINGNDEMLTACVHSNSHSQVEFFANTGTTYYILVSGWNTSSGDYTLSLNCATPPPPTLTYCSNGTISDDNEWIANVQLNTLSNNSSADGGYGDYTALSTDLTLGQNYAISLTPAYIQNPIIENWSVYIDWNQDGNFGTGELALQTSAINTVNSTITVPANAVLGSTRMRVILSWDEVPATACSSFVFGEIEDYTVNIISGNATCPSILYANGVISNNLYEASDYVYSDATVNAGSTVNFQAPNFIHLQANFDVPLNSQFTANIANCGTPPLAKPVTTIQENNLQIQYELQENSNVFISLQNTQGQIIQQIIDGVYTEKGIHQIEIGLPDNGIYFLKVQTSTQQVIEKIIVTQ